MTALNLGDADRVLTPPSSPYTSIPFGDVNFEPNSAPGPIIQSNGHDALPLAYDAPANGQDVWGDSSMDTSATEQVTFIAIAGAPPSSPVNPVDFGFCSLEYTSTALTASNEIGGASTTGSTLTFPTPLDDGITVFAMGQATTGRYILNTNDGTLWSDATTPTPLSGYYPSIFGSYGSNQNAALLGVWTFEDVDVSIADAQDTADAILAMLDGPVSAVEFSGASSWGIEGSATFQVGDLPEPVVPTIPAPGGSQTPPAKPTPATPSEMQAAGVYPMRHVWEILPATTYEDVRTGAWTPTSYGSAELGYLQITAEGTDITLYGGIETPFPQWRRGEPFGAQSATIELPQVTAFHATPSWAKHGANVSIDLVKIAGGTVNLFTGFVMDVGASEDSGTFTLQCMGSLFGADLTLRKPSAISAPQDIGNLIPALLNAVPGRRWLSMAQSVMGIRTSVSGGWESLLTGFIQELLATAIKGNKQYTIKCAERTPSLAFKDTTTIAATFRTGQRGVHIDLNSDASQAPNVLYGSGVNPDGGGWSNWKYPNWKPDDTPAFPNTNPADTLQVGRTDASTDSGDGVSVWQAKAGRPVTGYLSQGDRQEVYRIQRRGGIQQDGIIGPQTWGTTFDTGANTGTLDGAFVAPLAFADEVMPRLYGPDGDDLGTNPDYDPDVPRVEDVISYGQGVWRYDAIPNAEQVLKRDSDPGWQGSISLELDPSTKSKYELFEGENIRLLDWRGDDIDLHIALAQYDANSATFDVDTNARDYPTLQAIRTRDRDAVDPAKTAAKRLLEGNIQDGGATYDAESPAGRMPKHAIFTNLWDVRRMPMGSHGRIVRTRFTTSGSPQPFALAVFGKPLTAADLLDAVDNPLTAESNPWSTEAVDDLGLLQAWGWKSQPAGYYPGTYSDPTGEDVDPVTGRLVDDASWDYASEQSPWLWVAAIAPAACYIEGRMYGAPR